MSISDLDLKYISQTLRDNCLLLKNCKIFITGGTGFIGKWILESIIYANNNLNLNIKATVLTRNYQFFKEAHQHIAGNSSISFIEGDIRDFQFPKGSFNFIIHAATEASATLNIENPLLMADVIINGTRHVLDFALLCNAQKVLYLSSGAVYGRQPDDLNSMAEDFIGAPDPLQPGIAYGESKRMAEFLCSTFARKYEITIPIARCFSFVGPYLSLDKHYAIGNFINDGINKRDIIISGDGKPRRSYMYAADMVVWLITILLRGKSGEAYNVGSDKEITIEDLAKVIAGFFPGINVKKFNQKRNTDRNQNYIPNVQKAMTQFNLKVMIELHEAISRTINFNIEKCQK
jgi:nucleoside-diphosphate-sugar epimerase